MGAPDEREHEIFCFHGLGYLIQYNTSFFHLFTYKFHGSIFLYSWIVSHSVFELHFESLLIIWKAFRLFPFPSSIVINSHLVINIAKEVFVEQEVEPFGSRSCIVKLYGRVTCSFGEKLSTLIFQSDCTNLQSYQQWVIILCSLFSQAFLSVGILILDIRIVMKSNFKWF